MADQKITELTALGATPDDADIIPMVDDVAGTPTTKKVTVANLLAGVGGDFFGSFKASWGWDSTNGFTSAGIQAFGAHMVSFLGASGYIYPGSGSAHSTNFYESGKAFKALFPIYMMPTTTPITKFYFLPGENVGATLSDTDQHFGFRTTTDMSVYATNANGTTETSTDTLVDLPTGYQFSTLMVEFNKGVNCKFYSDNVLKATHTTNLPTGTDSIWEIYFSAGASESFRVGNIQVEREI